MLDFRWSQQSNICTIFPTKVATSHCIGKGRSTSCRLTSGHWPLPGQYRSLVVHLLCTYKFPEMTYDCCLWLPVWKISRLRLSTVIPEVSRCLIKVNTSWSAQAGEDVGNCFLVPKVYLETWYLKLFMFFIFFAKLGVWLLSRKQSFASTTTIACQRI